MSNPKHYWYEISRKMIMRFPQLNPDVELELQFMEAILKCLDNLSQKSNPEDRRKAIKMVLFDKTHTTNGASLKLHYSERNVQYWINEFVNDVGEAAGFRRNEK